MAYKEIEWVRVGEFFGDKNLPKLNYNDQLFDRVKSYENLNPLFLSSNSKVLTREKIFLSLWSQIGKNVNNKMESRKRRSSRKKYNQMPPMPTAEKANTEWQSIFLTQTIAGLTHLIAHFFARKKDSGVATKRGDILLKKMRKIRGSLDPINISEVDHGLLALRPNLKEDLQSLNRSISMTVAEITKVCETLDEIKNRNSLLIDEAVLGLRALRSKCERMGTKSRKCQHKGACQYWISNADIKELVGRAVADLKMCGYNNAKEIYAIDYILKNKTDRLYPFHKRKKVRIVHKPKTSFKNARQEEEANSVMSQRYSDDLQ